MRCNFRIAQSMLSFSCCIVCILIILLKERTVWNLMVCENVCHGEDFSSNTALINSASQCLGRKQ